MTRPVWLWLVYVGTLCSCAGLPVGNVRDSKDKDPTQDAAQPGEFWDVIGFDEASEPNPAQVEKYPGAPGAVASFLEKRESFYDQPFPSNVRQGPTGAPDLSDYPNPYNISLLKSYIETAEMELDGFSPNGAIYFRFDGELDPLSFPTVYETVSAKSAVFLVNVTQESQYYGEFIPVELWYWAQPAPHEGYYLEPYLLVVRPLGGFPMRAGEWYACVVTRRLKDGNGLHLSQSPLVAAALAGAPGSAFLSEFQRLRAWLERAKDVAADDVAVATVFKVSNPVHELVLMADYLRHEEIIELSQPLQQKNTAKQFDWYVGRYLAPNFQAGDPPYYSEGGFVFSSDGSPVVQRYEEITFGLTLPKDKPAPSTGWPVVMYAHGTGGNYKTCTQTVAEDLAHAGIATISIDQPLHGDRYVGPPIDLELYSFNFLNPRSARCLFRQSALDSVALAKFIKSVSLSVGGKEIKLDPNRLGFFGHSQGGLTGALYLAVENDVKAAVLSGAGGGLAYTIMLRKKIDERTYFDIKGALEGLLNLKYPDELSVFHPVLTLAQMVADVSDPINYSPFYFSGGARVTPLNVLITEGVDDPYTPAVTTNNLAIAGSVPPIKPIVYPHPGFDLRKLTSLPLPIFGNIQCLNGGTATAALAQFDGHGHFVAFDNDTCRELWLNLLSSGLLSGKPVIYK